MERSEESECVVCASAVGGAKLSVSVTKPVPDAAAGDGDGTTLLMFRIFKLLSMEVTSGSVCWRCFKGLELATEHERGMMEAVRELDKVKRSKRRQLGRHEHCEAAKYEESDQVGDKEDLVMHVTSDDLGGMMMMMPRWTMRFSMMTLTTAVLFMVNRNRCSSRR